MAGALMINIMFNLTRIAEKHNEDHKEIKEIPKKIVILFILSFPIILGSLFMKDHITTAKKEKLMISSGKSIIDNGRNLEYLVNYTNG